MPIWLVPILWAFVRGLASGLASWLMYHGLNVVWDYYKCAQQHLHSYPHWKWYGPFHVHCW